MGEVEQEMDLGTEPINTDEVTVPTEETVIGFELQKTKSDLKPCQIIVTSTERPITVCPGSVGVEEFKGAWRLARKMLQTDEGKLFVKKVLRGALKLKPLKLKTQIVEVVDLTGPE